MRNKCFVILGYIHLGKLGTNKAVGKVGITNLNCSYIFLFNKILMLSMAFAK